MFPSGLELSTELLTSLFDKTVTPSNFIMTHNRNILAIENQLLVNQSQINNLIQTIQFVQNIHSHQLRHQLVKIQTKYQAYVNLIAEFTNKRREYFLKMMGIITNKQKLLKQIAKSNVREFYNPVKSWVSGGVKNRENIAILRAFLELSLNYTRYRDSRSILNQRLNTLYKAVGDLQTSIMKALQNFVQAKVSVDFSKMKSNNEMLLNKLVLHEGELYNNEKDLFKIEKQYRDVFGIENEYVSMLAPYVGRVNNLFMATTSGGGKLDLGGGDAEAILSSSAIIPDLRAGDVYSMAGLLQHQLKGCEYALHNNYKEVGTTIPQMIRNITSGSDITNKMSQLTDVVVNGQLALLCETLKYSLNKNSDRFKGLPDVAPPPASGTTNLGLGKDHHRGYDTTSRAFTPPRGNPSLRNYWTGEDNTWWTASHIGRVETILCIINEIIHHFAMRGFITTEGSHTFYNQGKMIDGMRGGADVAQLTFQRDEARDKSLRALNQRNEAIRRAKVAKRGVSRAEAQRDSAVDERERFERAASRNDARASRNDALRTIAEKQRDRGVSRAEAQRDSAVDERERFERAATRNDALRTIAEKQRDRGVSRAEAQRDSAVDERDRFERAATRTLKEKDTVSQRLIDQMATAQADRRERDSKVAAVESKLRVAQAHIDETWIDRDFGEGILGLAGGARKRKAKKNYKGQKGGAAQNVPDDLTPLRNIKILPNKGKSNQIITEMFGPVQPILTILEQNEKNNLFGFRPMVRPEILSATLGSVLGQIRSSIFKDEKTLSGISDISGLLNRAAGGATGDPLVSCFNMVEYQKVAAAAGAVSSFPSRSSVNVGVDDMYFKTIDQFAEHLQKKLSQLNKVLVQSWKVHKTYTENINKVKNISEKKPNGVEHVERLWENMNAAVGIAYVYDNPKPLDRIDQHLKELSAEHLYKLINNRGPYNPSTHSGRLWYKSGDTDSKGNTVSDDDITV